MPDTEEKQPVLSSAVAQQGIADDAGGLAYSGVSGSTTAGEVAFQGPTADFMLYGVVNGSFGQGPIADPGGNIDADNNPLPYWYGPFNASGGAITAKWVEDSAGPSGYKIRFTMPAGAAGDEVYFEQKVPIGGSQWGNTGNIVRSAWKCVDATGGGADMKVSLQYLKADDTTTGSATSTSSNVGAGTGSLVTAYGNAQADDQPPGDAAFLRIRVGIVRGAGAVATDTAVIDLYDVRNDAGHSKVVISESTSGSFAPGWIDQQGGVIGFHPNGETTNPPFFVNETQVWSDVTLKENDRTVIGWDGIVTKSSNEDVTNSAALQDDDELAFAATSAAFYEFEAFIIYVLQSGTAADIKIAFGEDATATRGAWTAIELGTADAAATIVKPTDNTDAQAAGGTTTGRVMLVRGWHRGNGGTFVMRWAQNAATVGVWTRVATGSVLRYRRVL